MKTMTEQKREMEFFRGVYQVEVDLLGEPAKLPVFYYDASSVTAIFPASMSRLRDVLPKKEYYPLPVAPGVGALAITAFDYRDTDIRPYKEISISILMSYKSSPIIPAAGLMEALLKREFHAYIHHLPVTTEIALEGGVRIYNYPKFLSEITYEDRGDETYVELRENGRFILCMRGKKLRSAEERKFRFLTYPVKENRAQLANILFYAKKIGISFNPTCATLELGNEHPIGRELQDMILLKKPIHYMDVPECQAILYGPSCLE